MYMSPNANRMHDVMNLRTKKGWRLLGKMIWRYKWIYLIMLLPGLALTIVFRYLPLPGILLAFKTYKPLFGDSSLYGFLGASPWVGMDQFMRVFSEPAFWTATRNTVVISLLKLLVGFPFPIVLAILLSEMTGKRYKRVLQTVYTFPHFLSWVVLAGIMLNLFGDTGALKKIAMLLDPDVASGWNILYNTRTFRTMLILSDVWKEGGWGTILYLAAITGIDPSLNEAATIDGANRWHKILHITWPGILPVVLITLILRVGSMMDAGFDQVMNLYNNTVLDVADILDTYIYRITFQRMPNYGFSTAVGLFKGLTNCILLLSVNAVCKKINGTTIM